MHTNLTPEQVQKLNTAIDKARNPGHCQYVEHGEPCCVIGQLGALEGVSVKDLKACEGFGVVRLLPGPKTVELPLSEALSSYPRDLLADLQCIWDSQQRFDDLGHIDSPVISEDNLKPTMKRLVASYA